MMSKKKMSDTTRKNVARSPVVMMIHPLYSQDKSLTSRTIMMGKFYPDSRHYIVAV
jgi:hypothetical protein